MHHLEPLKVEETVTKYRKQLVRVCSSLEIKFREISVEEERYEFPGSVAEYEKKRVRGGRMQENPI